MSEDNEQLDRIEKKLNHVLEHLHLLGGSEQSGPPPVATLREGDHRLLPTEEELRRRAGDHSIR